MVLGASTNPSRYSHMAVNRLKQGGHPIVAVGKKPGDINGIPIITGQPPIEGVDTITLYLNPQNQESYYNYILQLHPRRIIFNPGAENPVLAEMANDQGIQPVEACTLVLLNTGQY